MNNFESPILKQPANERTMKAYAAFITALAAVVLAARWLDHYTLRTRSAASQQNSFHAACARVTRALKKHTSWPLFGHHSIGLTLVVGSYVLCNAIFCVTPIAIYRLNHFASRLGWLTALNMVLCILFGLKNTPLGRIARVSHLELNLLHRVVGYTTVAHLLLHAALYTWYRGRIGYWSRLVIPANLAGIGAGISMLILGMGVWRHRNYELFYVSHVGGCAAALFLAYLHRPNWLKKIPVLMALGGLIWFLDRVVRAASMLRNAINNHATLFPLPGDATRILLRKPNRRDALPGSHCFLWIPCINISQNHPFTIVSNGPSGLEILVRPREGFTKVAFGLAIQDPGKRVLASFDGPYGSVPDIKDFDRIVLVAGGSGAAFTVGLLNRFLDQNAEASLANVYFIWTIRETVHMSWFYPHLCRFAKLGAKLVIYITNDAAVPSPGQVVQDALEANGVISSMETSLLSKQSSSSYETMADLADMPIRLEAIASGLDQGVDGLALFHFRRMKPEEHIGCILEATESADRVLVATCGPHLLIDSVRDTVHAWRDRRSIALHSESFGGS